MGRGKAIHYAGALRIARQKSLTVTKRGWAACCSGDPALAIVRNGNHTYDQAAVTCRACLKQMAAAEGK